MCKMRFRGCTLRAATEGVRKVDAQQSLPGRWRGCKAECASAPASAQTLSLPSKQGTHADCLSNKEAACGIGCAPYDIIYTFAL